MFWNETLRRSVVPMTVRRGVCRFCQFFQNWSLLLKMTKQVVTITLSILTYFKIHSLYYSGVGTWHSDPHHTILVSERDTPIHILSWCRNVTPDPYTILVSERDTRSIYYPGVGTWHPILYYYPDVGTWHPILYYFSLSSLLLYQGIIINKVNLRRFTTSSSQSITIT